MVRPISAKTKVSVNLLSLIFVPLLWPIHMIYNNYYPFTIDYLEYRIYWFGKKLYLPMIVSILFFYWNFFRVSGFDVGSTCITAKRSITLQLFALSFLECKCTDRLNWGFLIYSNAPNFFSVPYLLLLIRMRFL